MHTRYKDIDTPLFSLMLNINPLAIYHSSKLFILPNGDNNFLKVNSTLNNSHTDKSMSQALGGDSSNEDLKAFERRLTEIVKGYRSQTYLWQIIILVISTSTAITSYNWFNDTKPLQSAFQALAHHTFFYISLVLLVSLFLLGYHKRVIAPTIELARIRAVLNDFNMSCDSNGRLILKGNGLKNAKNLSISQNSSRQDS